MQLTEGTYHIDPSKVIAGIEIHSNMIHMAILVKDVSDQAFRPLLYKNIWPNVFEFSYSWMNKKCILT